MSPQGRRPISSREVRSLLRRADRLFAEGAKLQALARKALIRHFKQEIDNQPTAEDRERRQRLSKKVRKK